MPDISQNQCTYPYLANVVTSCNLNAFQKTLLHLSKFRYIFIMTTSNFDENTTVTDQPKKISVWISWRMFVVVITFFSVCLHAIMRNIIGITMICMVNATAVAFNNNENLGNYTKNPDNEEETFGYSNFTSEPCHKRFNSIPVIDYFFFRFIIIETDG